MELMQTPLIGAKDIAGRVRELGREIAADLHGREVMVVTVLKGGVVFASDLVRHMDLPMQMTFVRARSYNGADSLGTVTFPYWPEESMADKNVLIVEDVLDTGRTTAAILERIEADSPATLRLCVLLDKPERRVVPVTARYVGFTIPDTFVVGYGLDYNERYRELPAIHQLQGFATA